MSEIVQKLFRKRSTIPDFPGVPGRSPIPVPARRNSGEGAVSAIILKAIVKALTGAVLDVRVEHYGDGTYAVVTEHRGRRGRRTSALRFDGDGRMVALYAPNGLSYGVTYHCILTSLAEALTRPDEAADLVAAYRDLLRVWEVHGQQYPPDLADEDDFHDAVLRVCDETYFWFRYGPDPKPDSHNDRIAEAEVLFVSDLPRASRSEMRESVVRALTDLKALDRLVAQQHPSPSPVSHDVFPAPSTQHFHGPQLGIILHALRRGRNVFAFGPTGTGKTACIAEALGVLGVGVEEVKGAEGMLDLDLVGAFVPVGSGHAWADGPLARAFRRAAGGETVVVWIDEATRIPTRQLNVLLGAMNPESASELAARGISTGNASVYYTLEIPGKGETLVCPADKLVWAASANLGRDYAVHGLDPALARRFHYQVEFSYLPESEEVRLIVERTGVSDTSIPYVVARVAARTREMHANAQLPSCLDTGSAIVWAEEALALIDNGLRDALIESARHTWIPRVAGLDHTGRVDPGVAAGLEDVIRDAIQGGAS